MYKRQDQVPIRLPHLGRVVIGNNVEIGALNTIARGTLDDTYIGDNVKTDDHVHIAHNVYVGKNTIITACSETVSYTHLDVYKRQTLHRPLNVDDISRLKSILTALHESGRQIVFPVHPRTHKNITESELGEIMNSWLNFRQLSPLSYATFLALAKCAYGIVTDSGGVQKEAYFLGTPCTTIFPNTPWPETLKSGWNVLAEPEKDSLLKAVERPRPKGKRGTEFGNGDAALKIVKLICNGR